MITNWKSGELIRERQSGKAFLVLHVYKNVATIMHDLAADKAPPAIVLLEREYAKFCKDNEMSLDKKGEWKYEPVEF